MRRIAAGVVLASLMLAPAVAQASSACRVLADPAGDVGGRKVTGYGDDITGVWLDGGNDDVLVAEVEVSGLGSRPGRWAVSWVNPWLDARRGEQAAFAERGPDGVVFWAVTGDRVVPARGAFDHARDVVRIFVPREQLTLAGGTMLEDIHARTWLAGGDAARPRDETPSTDWTVGAGCNASAVQPCPVVIDAAGDAGIGSDRRTQLYSTLDIRSVGVAPAGDMLEVSLRVLGATPDADEAVRRAGFTIGWRYGGHRWFAQMERDPSGTVFRYGRAAARGPTLVGGLRTSGAMTGRVLRIWVPRARVGMPGAGDVLTDVTAWSWMLAGTPYAQTYHTTDDTAARRADAGVICPA